MISKVGVFPLGEHVRSEWFELLTTLLICCETLRKLALNALLNPLKNVWLFVPMEISSLHVYMFHEDSLSAMSL